MATRKLPRHGDEEWRPAKELDYQTLEWRDLPNYYASNQGRICHFVNGKYRLLNARKDKEGYCLCYIDKKRRKVHRIIASTFLEVPEHIKKPVVDHINGIKSDNRVGDPYSDNEEERGNLRWVTVKENTQAAHDKGLVKERKMMKVLAVDPDENAVLYRSQRIAAQATGIDFKSINQVVRGLNRSAGGYRFIRINNFTDKS